MSFAVGPFFRGAFLKSSLTRECMEGGGGRTASLFSNGRARLGLKKLNNKNEYGKKGDEVFT